MATVGLSRADLRALIGAVQAGTVSEVPHAGRTAVKPFITISREAGAGGNALGRALADRLSRIEESRLGMGESTMANAIERFVWRACDRELIEQIAGDHGLSGELIASLENTNRGWVEEFFEGLGHSDRGTPSELAIFRRVVGTMRALAQSGRVIMVGLGGVFITRSLPGGVHVRLVAPLEHRVKVFARQNGLDEAMARDRVATLDRNRNAFYKKYWPHQAITPEIFHITLNSALLSDEQMVDCVLPILRLRNGP